MAVGASARPCCSRTARPTASRVASSVASVSRDRPAPTSATSTSPNRSPAASRSSSRRRTARIERTASTGSSWRPADAVISNISCTTSRGVRSSPSIRTPSGSRSMSAVAKREVASTRASRSATCPSSRRVPRYHGVEPSDSLSRRNPNKPASGSGESANQPSIAGISAFWMLAVRVTPLVSASRWRSAAFGSAKPSAASRDSAAAGDSPASSPASLATGRAAAGGRRASRAGGVPRGASPASASSSAGLGVLEVAHPAGDPAQRRLVGRYDVGAAQLEELDAVLEGAQERVGLVHRLAVGAADVAAAA